MPDPQVRVEREGPLEGALGVAGTDGVVEVLPQYSLAAAESRPGPRQSRIERHALLVDVARLGEAIPVARQLVGTQIQLVDAWAARHVVLDHPTIRLAQRLRQRADHPRHQLVLHREHVFQGMLRRVRPHDGAGGCFDQLRRRAKLAAGAELVPISATSTSASAASLRRSGASAFEAGRGGAGADEQVRVPLSHIVTASDTLKAKKSVSASGRSTRNGRAMNRVIVRAARAELCRIAIRPYLADGGGHRRRRVVAVGGLLLQRLAYHAVEPGHRGAARQGRWLFMQHGVEHVDHRRTVERHFARQHLEEHRRQGEKIARASSASPRTCSGAM